MAHLIDKDAVVAEIERLYQEHSSREYIDEAGCVLDELEDFLNTLEVKEVDLEKEIDRVWNNTSDNFSEDGWKEFENIAKHFFELGIAVNNKAQKGE